MSSGLVLNTNLDSLIAQNSLTTSGNQLTTALQQLSSGLQINTAADNAAGYAIAQGMTSQINGLNTAINNANDGVSLTQTAQGALTEITNDLQTMRDLAVQSLNATNSATDRADLNQQFQQLSADIQQVASTASFNGVNLFNGTFNAQTFQIGANAGETITVSNIANMQTTAIGQTYSASATSAAATGALTAGALVINGVQVGASTSDGVSTADSSYSALAIANAVNSAGISGVQASANATAVTGAAAAGTASATLNSTNSLVINGVSITGSAANATAVANDINLSSVKSQTGVSASVASGKLTLTASDGRNITVAVGGTGGTWTGLSNGTTIGTVTLTSTATTQSGAALDITSVGTSGFTAASTAATQNSSTISTANVTSVVNSNSALSTIDSALQQVATAGAQLGAYQNRFQAAISGLQSDATNLSSARSSIVDTNYAQATSDLSKAQILQQASTAMVAQANTIPQQILTLLQKLP